MTRTLYARLARLGRWPRRIAALLCLVLAAASALSAQRPVAARVPATAAPTGVAGRLAPGQLAVPVTLSDDSATRYLHTGDRIDLYATPDPASIVTAPAALVGTGLLVIEVLPSPAAAGPANGTDGTRVIVAVERRLAGRIAGTNGRMILAVVDKYP
jgi:hypothetical protein